MRDEQEQGPPPYHSRGEDEREKGASGDGGWIAIKDEQDEDDNGRRREKEERRQKKKNPLDLKRTKTWWKGWWKSWRLSYKVNTSLKWKHWRWTSPSSKWPINSFRSKSCSWQRRSQPQKKIHQSDSYVTWSCLIFSGKYNGGTSKGTKDPKCADSKEARSVCAVGVVYPAHLGKTKTSLWYF